MIALITPGWSFLYDISEKQADEYSKEENFSQYNSGEFLKGWIFHSNDIPGIIRTIGVYICYVDLNEISNMKHKGYLKLTVDDLSDVWSNVFLKQS